MQTLTAPPTATVMVVEDDVLVRLALADYLRDCGYRVLEVETAENAIRVLEHPDWDVDVVLSALVLGGATDGFALARWVRENRPGTAMILAGSAARAADAAGELCDSGPDLGRPYDPRLVVERIRQLRTGPTPTSGLAAVI